MNHLSDSCKFVYICTDACSFFLSVQNMASVLQKLITPLVSGAVEPPRNKVTVVGVGQVGMACAVSILLQVRLVDFCTLA